MNNPNILLVTRHFPPILNGPSIVLSRLVKHWTQNSISVFTRDFHESVESTDSDFIIDIPITRFPWGNNVTRIDRIKELFNIRKLVKSICNAAIRRKSNIILGVTDDGPFFISAYLAAKRLKIPLVIYMLDLYGEGRRSRIQKFFAKRYEQRIFDYTSAVLVMSERMQEHYQQKYGIESTVIPHPIDAEEIVDAVSATKQEEIRDRPLQIVFTGHITAAQYGSVEDLIKVVGENPAEFFLKLCVPAKGGLGFKYSLPPNVEHVSLDREEVRKAQRDADVLFLPYAFNNPYPDIIRTASPSKLPEYLAAGCPILYYGPEYSYVKWYFDKTKAALCVTRPEKSELLKALRCLKEDTDLRNMISENAIEAARIHQSKVVANSVWQIFKKVFDAEVQSERKPPIYWLRTEPLKPITGGELRYYEHINYLRGSGWKIKFFPTVGYRRIGQIIQGILLGLKLIAKPTGIVVEDVSLRDTYYFLNYFIKFKHRIITFALEAFPYSEEKLISRFLFKRYFHNVHSVIVASKFMKDWVVKMGAHCDRVHIIPDAGRVKGAVFFRKQIKNPVRILCVAHIRSNKGQDVLLKALAMLPRGKFQVRLAGAVKDPLYKAKVVRLINEYCLEEEVVWLGMLGKEALIKEYEKADIFVLPSYREGFGQVILEAMSFGLPMITSRVGAIPELIDHMKNGILVDAGNSGQIMEKIKLLCADKNLTDKISKEAFSTAVRYPDWDEINSRVEDVIQRLL